MSILYKLIDEQLDKGVEDLDLITTEVVAALSYEDLLSLVVPMIRRSVGDRVRHRESNTRRRMEATINDQSFLSPNNNYVTPQTKWTAISDSVKSWLAERIWVGREHKLVSDMTAEDWNTVGQQREKHAKDTMAGAVFAYKIRDLMVVRGVQKTEYLSPEDLETALKEKENLPEIGEILV